MIYIQWIDNFWLNTDIEIRIWFCNYISSFWMDELSCGKCLHAVYRKHYVYIMRLPFHPFANHNWLLQHTHQLRSGVFFCCWQINNYAFETSDFPLKISVHNKFPSNFCSSNVIQTRISCRSVCICVVIAMQFVDKPFKLRVKRSFQVTRQPSTCLGVIKVPMRFHNRLIFTEWLESSHSIPLKFYLIFHCQRVFLMKK